MCPFPLCLLDLETRVSHKQMPDHRLKGFRMRRYSVRVDRRHNRDGIANLCRVTPIPADDTEHFCPDLFGILQCTNQIRTDILLEIAAANRENKDRVDRSEAAGL